MASKRREIQLSCVLIEPKSDKSADLNVWGIHSCPGPSPMAQCLSCPACLRKIGNNQSRMKCISCEMFFHLKCFGEEADRVRTCKLCQTPVLDSTDPRIDNCSILNELKDIVESRGIKLIHQNICSLLRKMDELRLMISELKSGIHILTLSETWLAENISDAEIEIAGPPDSSDYHDCEFMPKFDAMLDLAIEQVFFQSFKLNSGFVFKFEEVKEQFILNNLHKIDVKKAAGLDNIPPRLLKDSANVIARPLTKIINVSLEQGTVPDDFKLAKVIPVFKKGQPENMDNYRPISVLPTVSKLLEKQSMSSCIDF
ncbi:Hypothetical predicted protein [Paramuricea clavata]|uniref:Uncharacterized protein n=1 Tax=Paramuricea clavata TaxID=317549 RepID=A0A6S7GBV4_PARCT|nr:Hypothetical predicted protein [Paramuricea clavata]